MGFLHRGSTPSFWLSKSKYIGEALGLMLSIILPTALLHTIISSSYEVVLTNISGTFHSYEGILTFLTISIIVLSYILIEYRYRNKRGLHIQYLLLETITMGHLENSVPEAIKLLLETGLLIMSIIGFLWWYNMLLTLPDFRSRLWGATLTTASLLLAAFLFLDSLGLTKRIK